MRPQPPWATDDQWAHVRQATGGGRAAEGGIAGPGLQPSGPSSRVPTGSSSLTSLSFKQKMRPTMDQNPYEGALGPTVGEASVTASNFSRLDIRKVIKTPVDVWKNGKQPTVPVSKIPGQNFELRAATRRSPRSKLPPTVDKGSEDGSDVGSPLPTRPALSGGKIRRASPDLHGSMHRRADASGMYGDYGEQPRSRSAMGMLEGPDISYISATQGTVQDAKERLARAQNPLSELEQTEVEVLNLKAQFTRLEQMRKDKEDEIKRLKDKYQIKDKEVAQAREVDREVEDFRQRVEERIAATEGRLPELLQQRKALEEVIRRLKLVNKGLTWRLNQGKEEQRVYQADLKDMAALSRDVVASRDSTLQSLAELKTQVVDDTQRREKDLARRQNTVEKMLRETKLYGERLKEEKAERDKATAEKAAEEELAMMLADKNGTSMAEELQALRQRRMEEKKKEAMQAGGAVTEAMNKIFEVCKTEDPDKAAVFLGQSQERHQKLLEIKTALSQKAFALKKEQSGLEDQRNTVGAGAEQPEQGTAGGEGELSREEDEERRTMEGLLGDIEAFAEQNRQVELAMQELTEGYLGWVVKVVASMVATSQDDEFLGRAHKLGRKLRRLRRNPESLPECMQLSMDMVRDSTMYMEAEVARSKQMVRLDHFDYALFAYFCACEDGVTTLSVRRVGFSLCPCTWSLKCGC